MLLEPKSGFHIAFNMFDTDGNQRVDKNEFLVVSSISLCLMRFVLASKQSIFMYIWWSKVTFSNNHDFCIYNFLIETDVFRWVLIYILLFLNFRFAAFWAEPSTKTWTSRPNDLWDFILFVFIIFSICSYRSINVFGIFFVNMWLNQRTWLWKILGI